MTPDAPTAATSAQRRLALLDAPSNLGLRPPREGCAPGCAKAPGALRDAGLLARLGAEEAGVVVSPRYLPDWTPGTPRNLEALSGYTVRLADRIGSLLDAGRFPLVLGGDCSILLGAALALRRRGRFGLAFLDGHSDFRHPGNAAVAGPVGAVAGEDLAVVTGRGHPALAGLEGLGPYLLDEDVAALGLRPGDDCLPELGALGIATVTSAALRGGGAARAAGALVERLARRPGRWWVHLDVDILDPACMPAADAPDPDGIDHADLLALLAPLVRAPGAVGLDVTVLDPDLDPDGRHARALADLLVEALGPGRPR